MTDELMTDDYIDAKGFHRVYALLKYKDSI